jgi:hypothetical protein
MEMPCAKTTDGSGGVSFRDGLLDQQSAAHNCEDLGIEVLRDPALGVDRHQPGESSAKARVGHDLGAR